MTDMGEEWKQWPRDARYEVSNLGRVRTAEGEVRQRSESRGSGRRPKVVVSTPFGELRTHSLVMETWMPGTGARARHIDGDQWNNRIDNLVAYSLQASVPMEQVEVLAARHMAGESITAIADGLGLSQKTVRAALMKSERDWSEIRRQKMASTAAVRAASIAERHRDARARTVAKYEANGRVKIREMNERQSWEYSRNAHLRRNFEMSLKDYRAMVKAQIGKCALCGDPLPRWEFEDERVADGTHPVVDHCHRSDGSHAVRGVLHATCNAACGLMRDDPERARRMARYLERTRHERPLRRSVRQQGLELS